MNITPSPTSTCLINRIHVEPDRQRLFIDWQADLDAAVAQFPGFVSLEILSHGISGKNGAEWVIVQRFVDTSSIAAWKGSNSRKMLMEQLQVLLSKTHPNPLQEHHEEAFDQPNCVTEVFVTQIAPEKENAYRNWMAKIHQVQAKFPGFKGVYVQSPHLGQGKNWITLLQFDTPENLDRWLASPERQEALMESKLLIAALENHRIVSPYAGWFSLMADKGKASPKVWKQSMIILLVLFPLVMLQMRFFYPFTQGIDRSVATFIGNAISVALISWPLLPLAIYCLKGWLSPKSRSATFWGTWLVIGLYLVEIALFRNF